MEKSQRGICGQREKSAVKTKLFLATLMIALGLAGCGQASDDSPRGLQANLAAMLDDPAHCPSGTTADVQTLIDAAGPDGLVHIPAGCYEITDSIGISAGTRIIGAGMENTILYRDPEAFQNQSDAMIWIFGRGESLTQISGIAFLGVRNTDDQGEDTGVTFSNVRDLRVDHCYFEGFGLAAVRTEGRSRGVVDHSVFVDNFKKGIDNLGYGVAVYGTNEWAEDPGAGTEEAVFVEDNVFVGNRHAIASTAGAHYVFRHNLVQGSVEACAVDAHGLGYGSARGTQYVEIYDNVLEKPQYTACGIGIRGGSGVIFDNTLRGFRNPILLILEWGTPEYLKSSYPAKDQIREMWIWDNESSGGSAMPQIDKEAQGFIEAGRDFFTEPRPEYTPYTYPHPLVGDK